MNKKITKIIIGGALTVFLMGCSNVASKKYQNALAFLDSKDYTTSITLLEEVLEDNPNNAEAKELFDIISNYQKALELSKKDNIEEAKEILDHLSESYDNYSIKEDILSLISDLDKKINDKNIALIDDMFKKAKVLFDEGKYTECKKFLDSDVSPKVNSIKSLPKDTNNILSNLYLECDEYIEEEKIRVTKEEELAKQTLEESDYNLVSQPYSNTETSYSTNSSTSSQNNTPQSKPSSNSIPTPKPEPTPVPEPTPTPEPTLTPEPAPAPVVPNESTNPFSNGEKNINGFNYWVKDANHWDTQFFYKLVCAGMYNKITFDAPSAEVAAVLYYTDDSSFVYERYFENSQSYTGSYFGTYNGRSVNYIIEFNY